MKTLLTVVVAVVVLAGCGSSGMKTVVATTGVTSSPALTTETDTGTIPVGTPETTATPRAFTYSVVVASGGGVGVSATHIVHLTTFRSPTGNIGCVMLDGTARCDILRRVWKPPPRPASCSKEVDFGQGLEVGRSRKGTFVCAGDTALDPISSPLRHGEASEEGGFLCASVSQGMFCDAPDGHGFFISRQRYRVF